MKKMKRLRKRDREDPTVDKGEDGAEEPGKRYLHEELDDMVQTPFPDLTTDEGSTVVSDVDSDDEEAIAERQKQYQTKVDQDVAVFLKLTEQMSLESLLHLMEGQARTQNLDYIQKYKHTAEDSDSDSSTDSDDSDDEEDDEEEEEEKDEDGDVKMKLKPIMKKKDQPAVAKTKQFRFAEV